MMIHVQSFQPCTGLFFCAQEPTGHPGIGQLWIRKLCPQLRAGIGGTLPPLIFIDVDKSNEGALMLISVRIATLIFWRQMRRRIYFVMHAILQVERASLFSQ
jgi:hypothetical protein